MATSSTSASTSEAPNRARDPNDGGDPTSKVRRAIVAGGLALFGLVYLALPQIGVPCMFSKVLHAPCPTCGMTRAARALASFRFEDAWHLHPLSPLVVPLFLAFVGFELVSYVRTGTLGKSVEPKPVRRGLFLLAVLIFAVWISRFFGAFGGAVST